MFICRLHPPKSCADVIITVLTPTDYYCIIPPMKPPFKKALLPALIEFICVAWRFPHVVTAPINFQELKDVS